MAIEWAWLQGTSGDIPTYSAADDRLVLTAMFDEGVIRGMKPTGGTPARTVIIGTGQAVIYGDDAGNSGQAYVCSIITAAETVAIAAAPGSGTRIDLVGLQVQDLAAGGAAGNDIVTRVVQGTVGGGVPTAPATPASFLPICSVTISAGQTAVTDAMITNLRPIAGPKMPVGSLMWWYGPSSRIPTGWRCLTVASGETIGAFGSFPDLADLLDVVSGNIVVGNPKGRTLIGIDPTDATADVLGDLQGAKTTTIGTANLPAHSHTIDHDHPNTAVSISDPGHAHPETGREVGAHTSGKYHQRIGGAGSNYDYTPASIRWDSIATPATSSTTTGITASCDVPGFSGSSGSVGSGVAIDNMQPSMAVHLLLRVL